MANQLSLVSNEISKETVKRPGAFVHIGCNMAVEENDTFAAMSYMVASHIFLVWLTDCIVLDLFLLERSERQIDTISKGPDASAKAAFTNRTTHADYKAKQPFGVAPPFSLAI
jgi:hypothetical protein